MRNRGVIYSGRVGARMRVRHKRASRRCPKTSCKLCGGPWHGHCVWLSANGDRATLPFVVRGVAGQYRGGDWVAA